MSVRWGVLGTGWIAGEVLEQGIRRGGGHIEALGSRTLDSGLAFAKKHNIPSSNVFGSYDEVISNPNVDVVYLALPTHLHAEWTKKAAKAGKHVLCEKPVAATADEVQEMVDVCAENNVVFFDGTFWPHNPRTETLRKFLHPAEGESEIGKIRSVIATLSWFGIDESNIRLKPELEPMGALGDIGWYTVRYALFAYDFEIPQKVVGVITGVHKATGAARSFSGVLLFKDNRSATFDCS
ncbi:hypothetical protein HK096_000533, partial [Nowakowskiella sp. JEL0078]